MSEAINSMFRWYANSQICYAYLSDYSHINSTNWETEFAKSSWFERAWTLQELIAPTSVVFFDCSWDTIGSRSDLCEEIAEASGINHLELFTMKRPDLNNWSIAQRFSWASKRKATRVEDLAYSLLGIFDVNLPLLYGEGMKVFQRLQEVIVQQTNDQTIFAWSGSSDTSDFTSIFAPSAAAFSKDHFLSIKRFDDPSPMSISNLGLTMNVRLQFWTRDIAWAGLNCTQNGFDQIGIFILRSTDTTGVWNKCRVGAKFWHAVRRDDPIGQIMSVTVASRLTLPQLTRGWLMPKAFKDGLPRINIGYEKSIPVTILMGSRMLRECNNDVAAQKSARRIKIKLTRRAKLELSKNSYICVSADEEMFVPCGGSLVVVESLPDPLEVRAVMLGFDSRLRPFCILAEKDYTESGKVTEDMDACIDRSLSLQLKSFWQCSGLEEDGWIYPQDELIQHPSDHMRQGLWALKGDRTNDSVFRLDLKTGPSTFAFVLTRSHDRQSSYWSFGMQHLGHNILVGTPKT